MTAGVNGAGKTTQLQIIMGRLSPDAGEIIKAKRNMKIAYLAQVGDQGKGVASMCSQSTRMQSSSSCCRYSDHHQCTYLASVL